MAITWDNKAGKKNSGSRPGSVDRPLSRSSSAASIPYRDRYSVRTLVPLSFSFPLGAQIGLLHEAEHLTVHRQSSTTLPALLQPLHPTQLLQFHLLVPTFDFAGKLVNTSFNSLVLLTYVLCSALLFQLRLTSPHHRHISDRHHYMYMT